MNNAEAHTMTGAYAVDALSDDERRSFEEHLEVCAACRQEVAELQATAAQLGAASSETPPEGLKASVMAAIDQTRQLPPLPRDAAPAAGQQTAVGDTVGRPEDADVVEIGTPWYQRLLAPAAAVLTLVVIGQTAIIANMNGRMDQLEATSAPANDLLAAADLMTVHVEGPDGSRARLLASPQRGEGMFVVDGMSPAPSAQDYQLWLITAEGATPAGLLDIVDGSGTQMMTGDLTQVVAVGLTMEPEGGSPAPTTDPIIVAEMPADA